MEWVGIVTGVVGTVVAALALYFSRRDRHSDKLELLTARVGRLETQMEPFWAAVQADMIKILHHPWPERAGMDALLDRLRDGHITPAERAQLHRDLAVIVANDPLDPPPFEVDAGERLVAAMLIRTMAITGGQVGTEAGAQPDPMMAAFEAQMARVRKALRWYRYAAILLAIVVGLLAGGFWQVHSDERATCIDGNRVLAGQTQIWENVMSLAVPAGSPQRAQDFKVSALAKVHEVDAPRAC